MKKKERREKKKSDWKLARGTGRGRRVFGK